MTNVFVYGTLMRGEGAHSYLAKAEFVGEYRLSDYAIYNLGWHPGIRPKQGGVVYGEVYAVDDRMLKEMDRYEGEGSLYHRTPVTVENDRERSTQSPTFTHRRSTETRSREGDGTMAIIDEEKHGMYKVTLEDKSKGTTQVFDDLESMMLVMISPHADNVIFEHEFVDDVEHERNICTLLSLAQGYVFAGLAEYRKMVKDKTHNDILAQKSLDFMQDLIVKRAQEIKKEVFEE